MGSEAAEQFKEGAKPLALWMGVLPGPLAALVQLEANYALVLWACGAGREWPLHLVSVLALAAALGAGLLSWRNWRLAGADWEDRGAGVIHRSRFMSAVGMFVSLHAALVIVAQWAAVFFYGPCER
ncbi:MAG TPA: hypothetical protein VG148_09190 [Pyrinomonadaceae bacterium]|nr:hypothetical protein [Pyrinomonadaceae bacterium]